ncbi:kynureninase [Brevibacillus daliensis]|uniref:kynureninase n=1 Tax=Brevibacillus daliensis TaxID=2892995 RepID=UPI001E4B0C0E|nr:kynureninase [Brevibacillus daliensis]
MSNYLFSPSKDFASLLDSQDPLAHFRNEFYLHPDGIYLDGNSLGLTSKRAEKTLLECFEDWKTIGIDGWSQGTHPWFYISEKLGEQMAPLVGAHADEVIVTGSTTSNLHQILATFYKPEGKRTKIMANELDFPTDIYAIQSQLRMHGYDHEKHLIRIKSRDGLTIAEDDIIAAMSDEIAVIIMPAVFYRSGQLLDMKRLTEEAHKHGILIGFDGCHSVGSVPHYFSDWDVDFAFWCNYKYLNAGPGGVGSLYVNRKHFGTYPGLAGWFGSDKEKQFEMAHEFVPTHDAGAYQVGTPHILSLAPLIGSLEMFHEAGIDQIRKKSLQLTRYMMDLIKNELGDVGFTIGNPDEDHLRGGHVCLQHEEAVRICKALKDRGITPDFRAPNIVRLAPVALYNSYTEVYESVQTLKKIMAEKAYEIYENKRGVIA